MLRGGETLLHRSPSIEKETTFIFVNTLLDSYYDKMIENAMRNFSEMVWSGELIEMPLRVRSYKGRLRMCLYSERRYPKRKKE